LDRKLTLLLFSQRAFRVMFKRKVALMVDRSGCGLVDDSYDALRLRDRGFLAALRVKPATVLRRAAVVAVLNGHEYRFRFWVLLVLTPSICLPTATRTRITG